MGQEKHPQEGEIYVWTEVDVYPESGLKIVRMASTFAHVIEDAGNGWVWIWCQDCLRNNSTKEKIDKSWFSRDVEGWNELAYGWVLVRPS